MASNCQGSLPGSSSGAGSIGDVDFTPVEILFREAGPTKRHSNQQFDQFVFDVFGQLWVSM